LKFAPVQIFCKKSRRKRLYILELAHLKSGFAKGREAFGSIFETPPDSRQSSELCPEFPPAIEVG
jgi:hypothetical protein